MRFPHPFQSLAQIPDLAALLDISREFDVEITAFGSLVRRLANHLIFAKPEDELPDLFQLVPFLSDIDLRHSGTKEQTLNIRNAILDRVPFSECFRWQVFSEEELKEFTDEETYRPVIPANMMRLGTRAGKGIEDPFDGEVDLGTGEFRLIRSAFFGRSKLHRAYRDAELLYVLEYLKVLFEDDVRDLAEQPGWRVARDIASESQTPALLGALEESAYLRAKFWYRSQSLRATCRSAAIWNEVIGDDGIGPAIDYVNEGLPFRVLDMGRNDEGSELENLIATSCRLVGDHFRLKFPPVADEHDEGSAEAWETLCKDRNGLKSISNFPFPRLPAGQRIVADTPEFRFNLGKAPCAMGDEHIHVQVTLSDECARQCREYGEEALAAFLVLSAAEFRMGVGADKLLSFALPIPTVCWLVEATDPENESRTRLQIRANCGRLLEGLPDLLGQVHDTRISGYRLKLFVVGRS